MVMLWPWSRPVGAVGLDSALRSCRLSMDAQERGMVRAAGHGERGALAAVLPSAADVAPPTRGDLRADDVRATAEHPRNGVLRGRAHEPVILLCCDILTMALVWLLTNPWSALVWVYVAEGLLALRAAGLYQPRFSRRLLDDATWLTMAMGASLLVLMPGMHLLGDGSRVLPIAATVVVAISVGRGCGHLAIRRSRMNGRLVDRAVIVGTGQVARELAQHLAAPTPYGLQVTGFVESGPVDPDGLTLPVLGTVEDLDELLNDGETAHVLVAFGHTREADMIGVLRAAVDNQVDVHVVPRFFDLGLPMMHGAADEIEGIPLSRIRRSASRQASWRLKRALDVAVATVALIALAPAMALIALGVRTTSPGPILFRQQRIGRHGRAFNLLKFRSLPADHTDTRAARSQTGQPVATVNVPQAHCSPTRLGAWLRASSMDELPQLINILRGDMSLVGPRPECPMFVDQFTCTIPGYSARHRLPVGLTGWSQVNGLRQETSIAQRARFDNHYIERWSLWLDVQILLRTVGVVVRDVVGAVRR